MMKFAKGQRVAVFTREGWINGNVVISRTRGGSVAIQLDGYADLVYRHPDRVLPPSVDVT